MEFRYKKTVDLTFEEAVNKIKAELPREGFGVITEIDMRATLKKKLDVEIEPYTIIGACNPPFAYQALQAEQDIGLLLPCNLVVYVAGGQTFAACILPTGSMAMLNNDRLTPVAREVENRLKKVVDRI